jgi:hypothetical protein
MNDPTKMTSAELERFRVPLQAAYDALGSAVKVKTPFSLADRLMLGYYLAFHNALVAMEQGERKKREDALDNMVWGD